MTLKHRSLSPAAKPPKFDSAEIIAGLSNDELLKLRQKIDLTLKTDLSRLNLAEELGLQYRASMVLLDSVQDDEAVPANQRAQVLNSVRTTLGDIIKQQKIVFSAERLKRYESAMLKTLQSMPPAQTKIFYDLYGEFLAEDSDAARAALEP